MKVDTLSEEEVELLEETELASDVIGIIYRIDKKVNAMYPVVMTEVPKMQVIMKTVADAQTLIAASADRMATTNEKAESRYSRLEDRLEAAHEKAAGKGQMPIVSHYLILGGTILISVLIVLYVNQQTINATLTSIEVKQAEGK